jgi:hypothetical protein
MTAVQIQDLIGMIAIGNIQDLKSIVDHHVQFKRLDLRQKTDLFLLIGWIDQAPDLLVLIVNARKLDLEITEEETEMGLVQQGTMIKLRHV